MTCISGLLARLAPEIEAQLKLALAGLAGLFVRDIYLKRGYSTLG